MNKKLILICAMAALLFAAASYAEEEANYVIGTILELSQEESMIQVKDRNYDVALVLVDFGMGQEPVMGGMTDLEQGSLVKVYENGKGEDFWIAEKVIVFTGERKTEVLNALE